MALPVSKLPPSFNPLSHQPCPPPPRQPLILSLFPSRPSPTPILRTLRTNNPPSLSSKTRLPLATKDDSSCSNITELEAEEEEELFRSPLRPPGDGRLADRWREIHGRDDWTGLLDPMDPLLRSELIRYGEFAQACYDAFDYQPFSRYCGNCRYNRRQFFASLGMDAADYEVTHYLYATSNINLPNFFTTTRGSKTWSQKANWIGYIAVSDDAATARLGRRDVVIAWRGTVTRLEWVADLMDFLRPVASEGIPCPDPEVKVESGFIDLYTDKDPSCRFCKYSARQQLLTEVRRLVEQHTKMGETVSITVTGHSLGSALAMLSAYDIAETGLDVGVDGEKVAVTVFSFSGPRVGNGKFKERFEGLGLKALRVVNVHDTVPKVPGILVNEHVPELLRKLAEGLPWSYSHVGVELALDHKSSPFLKDTGDRSCFHNLEALLHLIDGYHGSGQKFYLASKRDPALVNKACDFLKDHLMVPPFWRQEENKGMVRAHDGRWVQRERQKIEDHALDIHHHLQRLGLDKDH
ncbi:phospholipase A1-Igamma1, chloroplastic-like [Phoenix dactylifera]|uniref:Phospholipase A1-Igamma1, chloroplastic-like n=1 Tax=Phoenix dactylifera TaxID=42345 RepID=A0A8B7CN88_PHODC|nr:phospholipase A1-Igamma1, chloroplastic-like [Phoenix dactylifera]